MFITRRTAVASLFKIFAIHAAPKALVQVAIHPAAAKRFSELPLDTIITLPPQTAEYEGKMDVEMPSMPFLEINVKARGPMLRYDVKKYGFARTFWTNLATKITIGKGSNIGFSVKPKVEDAPLPDYTNIKMKKVGIEEKFGEVSTILEVTDAPMMKDHTVRGRFLVTDDGIVLRIRGDEKNTAKNGQYKPMKMTMIEFNRRPQNLSDLMAPSIR